MRLLGQFYLFIFLRKDFTSTKKHKKEYKALKSTKSTIKSSNIDEIIKTLFRIRFRQFLNTSVFFEEKILYQMSP